MTNKFSSTSGVKTSKLQVIEETLHVEDANENELDDDRDKMSAIRVVEVADF